jgi:hypothetical protein
VLNIGESINRFLSRPSGLMSYSRTSVAFENAKLDRHQHVLGYELSETVKEFKEKDSPESVLKRMKPENFHVAKAPVSYAVGDGGIWSNIDDLALWDEAVRTK